MNVPRPAAVLFCAIATYCYAETAPMVSPRSCADFLGHWSGTWSQGFYGTQRIHVTHVTGDCIATLAYSPTEAAPTTAHKLPIKDGLIAFACNVPGGVCRLEVLGTELRFTYTEPSGFINNGVFRKDR